ncbi:hypothetical protein IFR05_007718 [Cadophora sp. M221]|nr:hypothetical protein IFR05_007718 [Cadophora sp. M221]
MPASSTSGLCPRCASIDLSTILQQYVEEEKGTFITSLESQDELRASACPLCRLFGTVTPSNFKGRRDVNLRCQLRAFSATKIQRADSGASLFGIGRLDVTVLGVLYEGDKPGSAPSGLDASLEETGVLCPIQNDRPAPYFGVRMLGEAIDVDFVKRCISHCQEHHSLDLACRVENGLVKRRSPIVNRLGKGLKQLLSFSLNDPKNDQSNNSRCNLPMRYFHLIDCTQRAVVQAPPGSPYIALSYVWGAPKDDATSVPDATVNWPPKLGNLPKTIEDSIEATLLFGLQYLWIDRYCINQLKSEEQQDQVSQMDVIYANAELTIIAAAGIGPDFGLPGVNKTKRAPHPTIRIGDITLASTLPHPSCSLRESKWATRGWTYQEGLLSKRRLIFTPQQTYFECNSMHMAESALMPLDVIQLRQNDEDGDLSAGAFKFNNPGSSPVHLKHFIGEYSGKNLTYPADKLNAMKGIFMHFGKLKPPVDHLMGIPMVSSVTAKSYDPLNCFLAGLSWRLENPQTRHVEFPSWTWAGWDGKLDPCWVLYNTTAIGSDVRIWIEHPDGSLSSIPKNHSSSRVYFQQDSKLANLKINFIHIEARTFTFQFLPPHRIHAEIFMGDFGFISYPFNPDQAFTEEEAKSSAKTFTAIIIGDPSDTKLNDTMIIGVEEKGDFAERVGLFSLISLPPMQHFVYGNSPTKEQFVQFLQAQPKKTIRLG